MTNIAIHTSGLTKSYGDKVALRGLELTIGSGEIFGLLGHNGAGKTTTVNLLTTLLEPTAGGMQVAGVDTTADPDGVRRSIGYLPENVQFYDNLSTMENLRFFGRLSGLSKPDARIHEVLDYLDFTGHDDQRVGSFSKGMRQRVGIAQAILHSPQVLFLDEPTSGLDPEGVRQLRDVIVSLNRDLGMTIFMNTHLLSEVTKTCTSIGILRQGELAYQASLEATLEAFPGEESLEEIYLNIRIGAGIMTAVLTMARQELVALRRERLPAVLLIVFVVMVSVSSLIGWLTNTTVSSVWEKTTQAGLTTAANPFADVSALYYARNTVIYLVLIGALMAIVVGVGSTMRDRKATTLDLVLSRPISVPAYLLGKLAGIGAWLAMILAVVAVISWTSISIITGAALTPADTARLLAFYGVGLVLLLAFAALGMLSGIYASRETTALLVPISIWSIIAFVLPQIGTSANPVSLLTPVPSVKVPGGAFDALNTVVSPLSVTEQFKTASGLIMANPEVTGSLAPPLSVIVLVFAAAAIALLATKRDRIRGALRD